MKLIIQFDGTDFHGWQQQEGLRTVQSELTAALQRLTGTRPVLHASSRTDAGVHAVAMPVSFETPSTLPCRAFVLGTNAMLAPDLRVLTAEDVPPDFHARFSALGKTYVYRVQSGAVGLPLERRFAWHVVRPLDPEAMAEAAGCLVGEHDFSAFRAAECDAVSPVRRLYAVTVAVERPGLVTLTVRGSGFLRNMVRILAGTLIQVGIGKRPVSWVGEVLAGRDRTKAGMTAPPQGLFLREVEYPPSSPPLILRTMET